MIAIRPDPVLVEILTSALNPRYYDLECTAGNIDTVQRLRARAFDVVITDPATSIEEDLALTPELRASGPGSRRSSSHRRRATTASSSDPCLRLRVLHAAFDYKGSPS